MEQPIMPAPQMTTRGAACMVEKETEEEALAGSVGNECRTWGARSVQIRFACRASSAVRLRASCGAHFACRSALTAASCQPAVRPCANRISAVLSLILRYRARPGACHAPPRRGRRNYRHIASRYALARLPASFFSIASQSSQAPSLTIATPSPPLL